MSCPPCSPISFIVNEDGDYPEKRALCEQLGVRYLVLERKPSGSLEPRSTTGLRRVDRMPYRIDLAGGWLDQPFVSKHAPGAVVTVSLEPTIEFNERSGMASSTRRNAIELWGNALPTDDPEKVAKILFCYDNPPGNTGNFGVAGLHRVGIPRIGESGLRRGLLAAQD